MVLGVLSKVCQRTTVPSKKMNGVQHLEHGTDHRFGDATMRVCLVVAVAALAWGSSDAFLSPTLHSIAASPVSLYAATVPNDKAYAQALTDYMAKAHAEKLKAIQAIEDKKNDEIQVSHGVHH